MSQLRSVTCHMGSHSVNCHTTQVSTPRLHPSQSGRYLIYLPRRDGRLSWPRWLATYRDGLPNPQTVTHPSTNRAQCRLTLLIKPTPLTSTTTLRRHLWLCTWLYETITLNCTVCFSFLLYFFAVVKVFVCIDSTFGLPHTYCNLLTFKSS